MTDSAKPKAKAKAAPDVLADLKDDLGIPASDTTNDAWLQRRVDGIWSRIEGYTGRLLASPPANFVDDWGRVVPIGRHFTAPPALASPARGTVFLRTFPVASIVECLLNDTVIAPEKIAFDADTGKLFNVDGVNVYAVDVGVHLITARARITYQAGFDTLPADLYEIIAGAIFPAWQIRQSSQAGGGAVAGAGVNRIQIVDVGEIDFADQANPFVDASTKRGSQGGVDPLLGPYVQILDRYVDWRSMTGAATYPTTERAE